MNRRGFLGALTAIAGTMTLDPERLLWVPGQKKIFTAAIEPLTSQWILVGGMSPAHLDLDDLRGVHIDEQGLAMARLGDSTFLHCRVKGNIKPGQYLDWIDPRTVSISKTHDMNAIAGIAL